MHSATVIRKGEVFKFVTQFWYESVCERVSQLVSLNDSIYLKTTADRSRHKCHVVINMSGYSCHKITLNTDENINRQQMTLSQPQTNSVMFMFHVRRLIMPKCHKWTSLFPFLNRLGI